MRYEALAELDRIACGKMRPFWTIESGKVGEVGIVNARRPGHFQKRFPRFFARRIAVFQCFESAAMRKAHENNFAAAGPDFFYCGSDVAKPFLDRFIHLREEDILRDITGWWRWREKRNPDLLDLFR